jgi:hypothetical protein
LAFIINKNYDFREDAAREKEIETMLSDAFALYEKGSYSPEYSGPAALDPGTIFATEEEDDQRLLFARQQVLNHGTKVETVISAEEKALHREARKGMTDDEVQFSVETSLDNEVYLWSDKYRPRKPRYFNR